MGDRILLMGLPTSSGIGTVQLYYRGVWGGKWPRNEEALTTRKKCESHGRAEGGVHVHMNTVTAKTQKAALAVVSPEVQAGCWEEASAAPS
ncbi:hypothetical protein ACRRTK_023470 [Alexandromys fortis]